MPSVSSRRLLVLILITELRASSFQQDKRGSSVPKTDPSSPVYAGNGVMEAKCFNWRETVMGQWFLQVVSGQHYVRRNSDDFFFFFLISHFLSENDDCARHSLIVGSHEKYYIVDIEWNLFGNPLIRFTSAGSYHHHHQFIQITQFNIADA